MAADALAPFITRPSGAMVLTLQDGQVLYREGFNSLSPVRFEWNFR